MHTHLFFFLGTELAAIHIQYIYSEITITRLCQCDSVSFCVSVYVMMTVHSNPITAQIPVHARQTTCMHCTGGYWYCSAKLTTCSVMYSRQQEDIDKAELYTRRTTSARSRNR